MSESKLSGPLKRPRLEESPCLQQSLPQETSQESSQPQELLQPLSNKQKLNHSPAESSDNLPLTCRALEELDRKNLQSTPTSRERSCRSVNQLTFADNKSSVELLRLCSEQNLLDIKLLAQSGGPNLSSLRDDYRTPTMASTAQATSAKKTGPYDPKFQQRLIRAGVFPHRYLHPDGKSNMVPNNWDELKQMIIKPNNSLSPLHFPEESFEKFSQAEAVCFNEQGTTLMFMSYILGETSLPQISACKVPFKNLDPLVNKSLVPGNPDLYYGAIPLQLNEQVCEELNKQIVPTTQDELPVVPNFFMEIKGPNGSPLVAGQQASYNGALGARGMHSLQSYKQEVPTFNGNAYTITSTYQSGCLKIYTSHPTRQDEGRPEYHTTLLGAYALTDSFETFREGATALRNARDWAKEQRDEAIREANRRAEGVVEQ